MSKMGMGGIKKGKQPPAAKAPRGVQPKKILSDGEVRGQPLADAAPPANPLAALLGAAPPGAAAMKKPSLGGNAPPARPNPRQTPAPRARPTAIGERPVMAKTQAKIKKMRGY